MTAGKGILVLLGLISKVLLSRFMNPGELGSYGLILSISGLAFMLANLGVQNSHVYNTVRGRVSVERNLGFSLIFATITGLIAIGFLYLNYISWLKELYFNTISLNDNVIYVCVLLFIPSNIIKNQLAAIIIGLKKFKYHNGFTIGESLTFLILLVCSYSILGGGLIVGLIAWASSVALASIGLIAFIFHRHGVVFSYVINDAKKIMPYGLKCFFAGLFQSLMVRLDILLVAYFTDANMTGIYYLATSLSVSLNSVVIPLNRVVFTYLCSIKINEATQLTNRAFKMSMYFGTALLLVLSPIIIKAVPFMFGQLYSYSTIVLLLLLPTNILLLLIRFIYTHLMSINSHEKTPVAYASAFVVSVIANILLIPSIGIIGAALSMNIAYLTCLFILALQYRRFTGVSWADLLLWDSVDSLLLTRGIRKISSALIVWFKSKVIRA